MEKTCKTCKFFCASDDDYFDKNAGECRFNPPVLIAEEKSTDDFHYYGLYPYVFNNYWCGEWTEGTW